MENIIFFQENYYYTCKTEPEIKMQELDEDEKDAEFVLKIVTIDEAIKANESFNSNDNFKCTCGFTNSIIYQLIFMKKEAEKELRRKDSTVAKNFTDDSYQYVDEEFSKNLFSKLILYCLKLIKE